MEHYPHTAFAARQEQATVCLLNAAGQVTARLNGKLLRVGPLGVEILFFDTIYTYNDLAHEVARRPATGPAQ